MLKAGRFDIIDSAVIISSVSKAKSAALLALMMMTAEPELPKCPIIRITFSSKLFSSHIYSIKLRNRNVTQILIPQLQAKNYLISIFANT